MTRLAPDVRKQQIFDVAMNLSRKHGYTKVTKSMIANACGVTEPLINAHFGTMVNLRRDVVRRAIAEGDVTIVGQALVARDRHVSKAPPDLRERAVRAVAAAL